MVKLRIEIDGNDNSEKVYYSTYMSEKEALASIGAFIINLMNEPMHTDIQISHAGPLSYFIATCDSSIVIVGN